MKPRMLRAAIAASVLIVLIGALAIAMPQTIQAASRTGAPPPRANVQSGFCTVTVQRGEALYMIAARFRTTTAYLAALNNLYNPNYIYAGMVLKVPCAPQPQPQPQPYPQPQPQPQPQPGVPICTYFTVQRGDWLKTIAARFGVSWQLLAQVNGLYNANYIYAGQKLAIPCPHPFPPPPPPPICPGCPPCQGCPPVYPTPVPTPVPPVMNMVEIHDNFYAPPVITVRQYQFVMWTNRGNRPHSVTQGLCPNGQCTPTPGGFNSGLLNPGGTCAFQFTQLGTFAYFDLATGMAGTVAVVP